MNSLFIFELYGDIDFLYHVEYGWCSWHTDNDTIESIAEETIDTNYEIWRVNGKVKVLYYNKESWRSDDYMIILIKNITRERFMSVIEEMKWLHKRLYDFVIKIIYESYNDNTIITYNTVNTLQQICCKVITDKSINHTILPATLLKYLQYYKKILYKEITIILLDEDNGKPEIMSISEMD